LIFGNSQWSTVSPACYLAEMNMDLVSDFKPCRF